MTVPICDHAPRPGNPRVRVRARSFEVNRLPRSSAMNPPEPTKIWVLGRYVVCWKIPVFGPRNQRVLYREILQGLKPSRIGELVTTIAAPWAEVNVHRSGAPKVSQRPGAL